MMKYLCLLFVVLASMSLGNAIVSGEQNRMQAWKQLCNSMERLAHHLLDQGMTLSQAFLAEKERCFPEFYEALARQLEESGMALKKETLENLMQEKCAFPKEEQAVLLQFLFGVANAVVPKQIETLLAQFLREAQLLLDALEKEYQRKSKIVRPVCTLGGLAIAILMI